MRAEPALRGKIVAVLLAFLLTASAVLASVVEVQIHLPVPQKIDVTGMRRLLVGGFRANDDPSLDIDLEYARWLKEMLRKRTTFEIIDADPPPLPEQELRDIVKNSSYWKRIAQRFSADLIVAGTVTFERQDKSGFVSEDVISPVTGQRIRRTRYAEREAFSLVLNLFFFRGAGGELLHEERLTEDAIYDGKGNDALTGLHQLADRSSEEILGVLMPRVKTETRYLFAE
jgi:nucleotide-binding universal stress UspA family protein